MMDQKIVFSEKLSKADTLILKNLEADIKDVSSRPTLPSNGHTVGKDSNGHTKTANGSTPVPLSPTTCLLLSFVAQALLNVTHRFGLPHRGSRVGAQRGGGRPR